MRALSFVIAGGGTGGHVTPALALGEAIARRDRNDRVLFIGSDRGLEVDLVPRAGFELVSLPSRQVMGRGLAGRALGAAAIARATLRARREINRVRADIVISVGGYAAMPAVLASRLCRTRLALVEPNAMPGRANRLTSRIAGRIFVGFPEAAGRMGLARGDARLREHGIPLRRSLVDAFSHPTTRRRPEPPYRLLVFGGSQGAHQINEAVMDALTGGADLPIEVFHQTGSADRERVAAAYAKSGVQAEVTAFEPDMPARYRWADLAVCRAGALTVAELALAGLPALLVPYPHAADDHQSANARALEAVGAAQRLDPQSVDGALIESRLRELLSAPDTLSEMSRAAARFGCPDAAERIIEDCVSWVEGAA